MVIDRHAGQNMPRFLIYDFITYDGESVIRKSFDERLFYIKSKLLEPRVEAMKQGIIKKELEPFSVRNKEFWPVTTARSLLSEKFAKSLSHEPDGLIFQPKLEPYVCGRCDDVLKWKPSDQNSVDFKLKIMEENGVG
jgi:mRNA-capping enzyme